MSRFSDALDDVRREHEDRDVLRVLGIDPGATSHGMAMLEVEGDVVRVVEAHAAASTRDVLDAIAAYAAWPVGIERVALRPGQPVGRSTRDTIELVGEFRRQAAICGASAHLVTRVDVLRLLGIKSGAGADGRVRRWVIARHGGDPSARGRKQLPEDLRTVTSHAWQAAGVAHAIVLRMRAG